jgi:hypothetical protein
VLPARSPPQLEMNFVLLSAGVVIDVKP